MLFFRYLLAVPAVGAMLLWRRRSFAVARRDVPMLALMALMMALSSLFLFESYNFMDASIASTLLFVYPLMVAVIMAVFFGERLTPLTVTCIAVALGGIFLLFKNPDGGTLSPVGTAIVMLSSLSYAAYMIGVNRPRLRAIPTLTLIFYVLAGGAMLDIGVYALSVMRLFMASQPTEVVSLGNTCETGVDVAGGIVCRNAEQQLGVVSLTLHSKQPKRSIISFDKCYIEVNEYPRADHATIVWTADGHREEVHAGTEAYALCYEMADLEKAVAGDDSKRELLGYASDVMELMTKLRADWGVVYPEEE